MLLDPDLVRKILMMIADTPANRPAGEVMIEGYDRATVLEHLEVLVEGNLIFGRIRASGSGKSGRILNVFVERLTFAGQEFLANARNQNIWARTREFVIEQGGSVSIAILTELLVKAARSALGLEQ